MDFFRRRRHGRVSLPTPCFFSFSPSFHRTREREREALCDGSVSDFFSSVPLFCFFKRKEKGTKEPKTKNKTKTSSVIQITTYFSLSLSLSLCLCIRMMEQHAVWSIHSADPGWCGAVVRWTAETVATAGTTPLFKYINKFLLLLFAVLHEIRGWKKGGLLFF